MDHPCRAHSAFASLVAPLAGLRHHTQLMATIPLSSTHPALMEHMPGSQSPSQDCTISARLTAPVCCSQHAWQVHSIHTMLCTAQGSLTAPIPLSQHPCTHPMPTAPIPHSHHPYPAHSTHARLAAPIPHSQHPCQAHRASARCVPPVSQHHAVLVAPMATSQQPHQSHDIHTSPTIPTQVPQPHTSP